MLFQQIWKWKNRNRYKKRLRYKLTNSVRKRQRTCCLRKRGKLHLRSLPPFSLSLPVMQDQFHLIRSPAHRSGAMSSHPVTVVEMRGIEPLSEKATTRLSPSAVCILTFPLPGARRQAQGFSSFINVFQWQSLHRNIAR